MYCDVAANIGFLQGRYRDRLARSATPPASAKILGNWSLFGIGKYCDRNPSRWAARENAGSCAYPDMMKT